MERKQVSPNHQLTKTLAILSNPGLLLASTKPSGEANAMVIGWGAFGTIWRKPIFLVMVRPSRYTYEFIEASRTFTVNVPTPEMREWVTVCGTKSGREVNKFGAYKIQTLPAQTIDGITIDACPMVYECRVVYHHDIVPAHLDAALEASCYGGSNYHRLYYGEIVGAFAADSY